MLIEVEPLDFILASGRILGDAFSMRLLVQVETESCCFVEEYLGSCLLPAQSPALLILPPAYFRESMQLCPHHLHVPPACSSPKQPSQPWKRKSPGKGGEKVFGEISLASHVPMPCHALVLLGV